MKTLSVLFSAIFLSLFVVETASAQKGDSNDFLTRLIVETSVIMVETVNGPEGGSCSDTTVTHQACTTCCYDRVQDCRELQEILVFNTFGLSYYFNRLTDPDWTDNMDHCDELQQLCTLSCDLAF